MNYDRIEEFLLASAMVGAIVLLWAAFAALHG